MSLSLVYVCLFISQISTVSSEKSFDSLGNIERNSNEFDFRVLGTTSHQIVGNSMTTFSSFKVLNLCGPRGPIGYHYICVGLGAPLDIITFVWASGPHFISLHFIFGKLKKQ